MKLLLDTHAFLWTFSEPERLTKKVRDSISDPENAVFVSAVSFWEIAIKVRLGKLHPLGKHPNDIVSFAASIGFTPIPLLPEDAASSVGLTENTHFDPFDRMLIWQAIRQDLTLISRDRDFAQFQKHGLKLLWK